MVRQLKQLEKQTKDMVITLKPIADQQLLKDLILPVRSMYKLVEDAVSDLKLTYKYVGMLGNNRASSFLDSTSSSYPNYPSPPSTPSGTSSLNQSNPLSVVPPSPTFSAGIYISIQQQREFRNSDASSPTIQEISSPADSHTLDSNNDNSTKNDNNQQNGINLHLDEIEMNPGEEAEEGIEEELLREIQEVEASLRMLEEQQRIAQTRIKELKDKKINLSASLDSKRNSPQSSPVIQHRHNSSNGNGTSSSDSDAKNRNSLPNATSSSASSQQHMNPNNNNNNAEVYSTCEETDEEEEDDEDENDEGRIPTRTESRELKERVRRDTLKDSLNNMDNILQRLSYFTLFEKIPRNQDLNEPLPLCGKKNASQSFVIYNRTID